MNSIVLCTGRCLQVFSVALKSLYEGNTKCSCQVRIFSVCFLASAPPCISENIYIRRPHCDSLIQIPVAVFFGLVVLCPGFRCYNIANLLQHFFIKHCRKSYSLRKYCSCPGSGKSVKSLIPPVIRRYPLRFHRRTVIFDLRCCFFQSHGINQFFCDFFKFFFHMITPIPCTKPTLATCAKQIPSLRIKANHTVIMVT